MTAYDTLPALSTCTNSLKCSRQDGSLSYFLAHHLLSRDEYAPKNLTLSMGLAILGSVQEQLSSRTPDRFFVSHNYSVQAAHMRLTL
jgi:hypothetical protein